MSRYKDDVYCPYCFKPVEIRHDDDYGVEEDMDHEWQCPYCDQFFTFRTKHVYQYWVKKNDREELHE